MIIYDKDKSCIFYVSMTFICPFLSTGDKYLPDFLVICPLSRVFKSSHLFLRLNFCRSLILSVLVYQQIIIIIHIRKYIVNLLIMCFLYINRVIYQFLGINDKHLSRRFEQSCLYILSYQVFHYHSPFSFLRQRQQLIRFSLFSFLSHVNYLISFFFFSLSLLLTI